MPHFPSAIMPLRIASTSSVTSTTLRRNHTVLPATGISSPARTGPETRFEVVVFGRRKGADVAERDVVVGYHQPFVGDHASRSHAAVHGDYGIGERRSLLVVNLLVLYLQPLGLHLRVNLPSRLISHMPSSAIAVCMQSSTTARQAIHLLISFIFIKRGGNRQPIPPGHFIRLRSYPDW